MGSTEPPGADFQWQAQCHIRQHPLQCTTHTYVRGVETYYASSSGRRLAESIQSKMIQKLQLKNRKTRLGSQYAVLNKTTCPAVLVECGYISNYSERQRCNRSWYQSLAASAIVDGILEHY